MSRAKYQFEDFLITIPDNCKDFVAQVHHILVQEKYKPRLTVTKSTGFQLAYHQPQIKSTSGIIMILFKRNEQLMIRIYGKNHGKFPDILNEFPHHLVEQIDKADNCKKFANPDKCWKGCIGYEFHIREKLYQKCLVNCFEFEVDNSSMPYLLKLIECESKARLWNEI